MESFDQLPPKLLEAIRVDDKSADKKRNYYEILYKRKAVEIFTPKLEQKIKLLTGRAKVQANEALQVLYLWRKQLPKSHVPKSLPKKLNLGLTRTPPPPILLPKPPTQKKKITLQGNGHEPIETAPDSAGVEKPRDSSEDESINISSLFPENSDDSSSDSDLGWLYFIPHQG